MYEVPSPYATRYAFSRFDGDELRGPLPAGALEDQVDVASSPAVSEATQLLYLAERQAERLLSEARREARRIAEVAHAPAEEVQMVIAQHQRRVRRLTGHMKSRKRKQ